MLVTAAQTKDAAPAKVLVDAAHRTADVPVIHKAAYLGSV